MSQSSPFHWSQAKVPPNGALIKIDEGVEKSPLSSGPKVLPGYRKRASTLSVISEHSEKCPERSLDDSSKKLTQHKEKRHSTNNIQSPTRPNFLKPVQRPAARAGTIKALGENVKSKFHIDDPVLAFLGPPTSPTENATSNHHADENEPIQNVAIRGTDYVIVSDAVTHIFTLPDNISLQVATKLGDKGVQALAMVEPLEQRCRSLLEKINSEKSDKPEKIKILSVFTDEMSLLAVPIFSKGMETDMDKILMTAATSTDEGIVWLKKNFPRVSVVQWNHDAYEQVLLERTKDACKGLIDIVISFDCSPRALLRSINLLKKDGLLICSEDVVPSVWHNIESTSKSQSKSSIKVQYRSPEILKELIDIVSEEKVAVPTLAQAKSSTPRENPLRRRSYSSEE